MHMHAYSKLYPKLASQLPIVAMLLKGELLSINLLM